MCIRNGKGKFILIFFIIFMVNFHFLNFEVKGDARGSVLYFEASNPDKVRLGDLFFVDNDKIIINGRSGIIEVEFYGILNVDSEIVGGGRVYKVLNPYEYLNLNMKKESYYCDGEILWVILKESGKGSFWYTEADIIKIEDYDRNKFGICGSVFYEIRKEYH